MKAVPTQIAQVQSSQALRRDYLRAVRDALELLLRDIELREKKYKFFYVVDFAAIYAYLYRTSDHFFIQVPGESPDKTFSRLQIALRTLFTSEPFISGSRKLVLTPPYAEELDSHLSMLETRDGLASAGIKVFFREPESISRYKQRLDELIRTSSVFDAYIRLSDKAKREAISPERAEELQLAAVKVAKDYFPELYATLDLDDEIEDRVKLRALLNKNILLNSDEELPAGRQIEYFGKKTDEWYEKIIQVRNKARETQTYTDAMACTYVETANQMLNPQKQIVVFAAPSRSVEAVLRGCKMISVEESNLEVVRNLTYCLLAFMQKDDKPTINTSLQVVKRLLEIYESPIPVAWRKTGDEAALDWTRCENLLLIRDSSMTDVPGKEHLTGRDQIFLELLSQLHQAAEDQEKIQKQLDQTLWDLHQKTRELTKNVYTDSTVKTLRRVKFERKGRRGRLVLPALEGELPFQISFIDPDVKKLAKNVGDLKESSPDKKVLDLRAQALEVASNADATPEHHLLAGYILALEQRYETALTELKTGLATTNDAGRLEFLFMAAAIHRKLYHAQRACDLLEQGLAINKEDRRLNVEYAKALWLKWRDQADRQKNLHYLDKALEHLDRASRSIKTALKKLKLANPGDISTFVEKVLRAQIENVSAYIYTEQALNSHSRMAANLVQAEAHLETLSYLLSPEKEWIGRFFDTRGYFRYAKAKSLSPDRKHEKGALLESAAQDVAHSLIKDEAAGPDLEVRREHQREINQALSEIGMGKN
jgi:hypothetical protein